MTKSLVLRVYILALLAGCAGPKAGVNDERSPADFLKWSMDQHSFNRPDGWKTFKAESSISVTGSASISVKETRSLQVQAPNIFRLETSLGKDRVVSISDGSKLVEYDLSKQQGVRYPAPSSISEITSSTMKEPFIAGSLIYQFFGGSANLASVASDPTKISFGKTGTRGNESTREVNFYEKDLYGNVTMVIGDKSGQVYEIRSDLAPVLSETTGPQTTGQGAKGHLTIIETFTSIEVNPPPSRWVPKVDLPKGIKFVDAQPDQTNHAPVPYGKPAPDFSVTSTDGKTVKLSSFKGKVVLLDFWATWCPPCREGLPVTAKFAKELGANGLVVMAISGEPIATISAFLSKQSYQLPAYHDEAGSASMKYFADSIPTTAIIDAKGNLSAYMVGLQEPKDIERALAQAGLTGLSGQ